MEIKLNGKNTEIPAGATVQAMLDELGFVQKMLVVEVNLQILQKENFASHVLQEGDEVEVITFVGGG